MSDTTDATKVDRSATFRIAAPADRSDRTSVWMLPVLLTGQGLAAMDTAIVNVAGPALQADLGVSGALLQMIVAGYGLAYATLLITGARLGDHYGYRRLFIIGVICFSASSLICGTSQSIELLVAARILQGIGAALLVPQVLSLIQLCYEGRRKSRAIGLYSMILGLGAAAGQFLGGVIVSIDLWGFGWRPAFLINVPIGIALLMLSSALPELGRARARKFDISGVIMIAGIALSILIPLTFGRELDWPIWSLVLLACGFCGLYVFWRAEVRLAGCGGAPLVDPATLLIAGVRPGLLVVLIGFIGYGGWLFTVALYLQSGLGLTALTSGLVFTAYALGFGISNLTWSRLPVRLLRHAPALALSVLVIASASLAILVLLQRWDPVAMPLLLFFAGCGHGLSFGTSVHRMTSAIPPVLVPSLSGLITTSSQFAIVSGTALLGSLYLGMSETPSAAMSAVAVVISVAGAVALLCALRLPRLRAPEERGA